MKFLAWLGKMAVTAALLSAISVYTTYYVVNSYVANILQKMNIAAEGSGFDLNNFLAKLSDQVHTLTMGESVQKQNQQAVEQEKLKAESPASGQGPTSLDNTRQPQAAGTNGTEPGGDTVAVFGQNVDQAGHDSARQDQHVAVSTEQLQQTKEKMTNEDKMKVFSILAAKLPQDEMQKISGYMEDGITGGELKEIQTIMEKYLTENEYRELIQILKKY
ncbi:hypothetical protein [Ferviditalea candida]|uniref:Spore coat protein n=1 Tax=Ferviditalea candida TaxID=3108399 RepID=A0ABU5ZL17_9BACL|nr:hypothetical protein [Paenibacillaceae bacterium T2]